MIKKFTLLMVALLLSVMGVNAKTKTTKVLWEGTYSNHIEISKDKLAVGTLTIYMSWPGSDGTQVRAYYKKNNTDWSESAFFDNSGTIKDWQWQNNGTVSYEINIAQSDMDILNDNTADTGSRGILYIGSADASKMKITMITLSTTASETETSTTSVWTGTHNLGNYSGLELTGNTYKEILKNAKIGDILRATYTSGEAGYINFCNGSGWSILIGGSFSVATTNVAATVEYEIVSATVLEAIQQNGIVMNGTNAVLSAVDLLTYSSSYDAVSIKVGSEGVATYSNGNKNVQISACDALKAYYASAVAEGIVTLTELTGCIPANTGVIVYGSEGTYTVPVGGEGWPSITTNYLKATGDYSQDVARSVEGKYHYIFAKHGEEIGFYLLPTNYEEGGNPYHTLAAHKAYLETDTDLSADAPDAPTLSMSSRSYMRLSFGGGGGTTAINTALKNPIVEDGIYYTLQGVAVKNPSKGIYILNGKKVFVK